MLLVSLLKNLLCDTLKTSFPIVCASLYSLLNKYYIKLIGGWGLSDVKVPNCQVFTLG